MTNIEWFEDWYLKQCDGEWQHSFGIEIMTIDNPGWSVTVDLSGTRYAELGPMELKENYDDETSWLICEISQGKFLGNGGPKKLDAIIGVFRSWIEVA